MPLTQKFQLLSREIQGELNFDDLHKSMYATDASVYREIPVATILVIKTPIGFSQIRPLVTSLS